MFGVRNNPQVNLAINEQKLRRKEVIKKLAGNSQMAATRFDQILMSLKPQLALPYQCFSAFLHISGTWEVLSTSEITIE